jgi:hypothetical protein
MLDVRLPIGGLFIILGIMIGAWGYTHTDVVAIAAKSGPLPINWDIIWGILMTIFGVAMFSLAKLDDALSKEAQLKEEKAAAAAKELATAIANAPQKDAVATEAPAAAEPSASADSTTAKESGSES